MIQDFINKVAVITGGASGIGKAMTRCALEAQMRVAIADINQEALDAAAAEFDAGDRLLTVRCDVSTEAGNAELAAQVEQQFGGANLVCLNAGLGRPRTFREISAVEWNLQVGVNLNGPFFGAKAFLPLLEREAEAHLVVTASVMSLFSAPMMAPYYATKAGVLSLAESLYLDLQMNDSSVGVSALMPGDTNTNAAANGVTSDMDPELVAAAKAELAAGTSPDIVAAAVFAAVREDSFYVLPNPGNYWEMIDARIQRIREGRKPEVDYDTF